jgi:hypothetical protein
MFDTVFSVAVKSDNSRTSGLHCQDFFIFHFSFTVAATGIVTLHAAAVDDVSGGRQTTNKQWKQ